MTIRKPVETDSKKYLQIAHFPCTMIFMSNRQMQNALFTGLIGGYVMRIADILSSTFKYFVIAVDLFGRYARLIGGYCARWQRNICHPHNV
uniref:Uncharacterized protein n=1 Tax=Romanomermis culicivorax TaxID=13658 RepID=A0A915K0W6_ROMCU